jgi:hypothetical protein
MSTRITEGYTVVLTHAEANALVSMFWSLEAKGELPEYVLPAIKALQRTIPFTD